MKTTTLRKGVLVVLATLPWTVCAHEQETGAIQEKLESKYQLTTIKDDQSDTVRTGSRLILRKGNLVMFAATSGNLCANTYRESEIRPSGACKAAKTSNSAIKLVSGIGKHIPHADKVPATQTFGKGDQFWVTKIEVTDAGMTFDLFSDAISDVHYKGALTIPCKSPMPAPDEALKVVAEVFEVELQSTELARVDDGTTLRPAGTPGTPDSPPARPRPRQQRPAGRSTRDPWPPSGA